MTNWFHAPRALAIFRKYQPGREFTVSFSPKPDPLTKWDRDTQRRERLAVLHNLIVHGVWSFGTSNIQHRRKEVGGRARLFERNTDRVRKWLPNGWE